MKIFLWNPINLLLFRTNPQVCRRVGQEPPLHPRPAVRGGEPGREPGQHQICCEERNRWKSKGGGQHSFPGGPSPELDCGTNHYYFDVILDTHTFVILNFDFFNFEMPAEGYKFTTSPNYVNVHYFHYVLTSFHQ